MPHSALFYLDLHGLLRSCPNKYRYSAHLYGPLQENFQYVKNNDRNQHYQFCWTGSTYFLIFTSSLLKFLHNIVYLLREAKVSCSLRHWGVQLRLAYSWARPAILVAGRGGMFLFLLFLHFNSFSSSSPVPLFHLLCHLFYLSSPFLWEMTNKRPTGHSPE